ncbi:hypothetical protein GC197_00565 [bacterium]|nr:hypothetical protein [bacterium]
MPASIWRTAVCLTLLACSFLLPGELISAEVFQKIWSTTPFDRLAFGLAAAPNGSSFAVAGRSGQITVFDAATNKEVRQIASTGQMILAIDYSPDSSLLAAVGPQHLMLYRTADGSVAHKIELDSRCGFICFHPTRPELAVAGRGASIDLYDYQSGKKIRSLTSDMTQAQGIRYSADGRYLFASVSNTNRPNSKHFIRRYDLASQQTKDLLHDGISQAKRVVSSADGKTLAVNVPQDGIVMLVEPQGLRKLQSWRVDSPTRMGLAFLPDGKTILTARNEAFDFWQLGKEEVQLTIPSPDAGSAYAIVRLPGTNDFLMCHERPEDQITRWRLSEKNRIASNTPAPPTPGGGFGGNPSPAMPNAPKPGDVAKTEPKPAPASMPQAGTPSQARPIERRTWRFRENKPPIEADVIAFDGQTVILRDDAGEDRYVAVSQLVETDANLISKLFAPLPSPASPLDLSQQFDVVPLSASRNEVTARSWRGSSDSEFDIPVGHLHCVQSDQMGRIWVLSDVGLLTVRENGSLFVEALLPDLSKSHLAPIDRLFGSKMAIDRFGRPVILFQSPGEAYRFDGTRWEYLASPQGLMILDLIEIGGEIYASGFFDGVVKLERSRWAKLDAWPNHATRTGTALIPIDSDSFYVFKPKERELTRYDSGQEGATIQPDLNLFQAMRFELDQPLTYPFAADGNGCLWTKTTNINNHFQLARIDPGNGLQELVPPEPFGLSGILDTMSDVDVAPDGAIWASCTKGTFRGDGSRWQQMTDEKAGKLFCLHNGCVGNFSRVTGTLLIPTGQAKFASPAIYQQFSTPLEPIYGLDRKSSVRRLFGFPRTWTDATGKYSTEATWYDQSANSVTLLLENGTSRTLPLSALSADDQGLLKQIDAELNPAPIPEVDYETKTITLSDGKTVAENKTGQTLPAEPVVNRIWDVHLARDGRIYLATDVGLVTYQGDQFQLVAIGPKSLKDSGLPKPFVAALSIWEDPKGELLIELAGWKSPFRYQNGNLIPIDPDNRGVNSHTVWTLAFSGTEMLGGGDFSGIQRWQRDHWEQVQANPADVKIGQARWMVPRPGGGLIMADEQRVVAYQNGRFELLFQDTALLGTMVSTTVRPTGEVMAGFINPFTGGKSSRHPILRIHHDVLSCWNQRQQDFDSVRKVAVAPDGALLVVTAQKILRYNNGQWQEWPIVGKGLRAQPIGGAHRENFFPLDNGDIWYLNDEVRIMSQSGKQP